MTCVVTNVCVVCANLATAI